VLLGNGDGTFQAPVTVSAGVEPFAVVVGDFNGDGNLDFAVSDYDRGVYIYLGNGDGTFQAPTLVNAGVSPIAIAAQDLNGDGKQDLAVAGVNGAEGEVSVLLGNGDGTFQSPVSYDLAWGFPATSIAIGDVNRDGKPDLVVTGYNPANNISFLSVLLGNGDGTFGSVIGTPTGGGINSTYTALPLSVAIANFDTSGKTDVAEVNGPHIEVLPGNGNGTFPGALRFTADVTPWALAVADFNGDGKPDIVVANLGSNDVTILLNATVP
jgi:FG-GAP-like repeat